MKKFYCTHAGKFQNLFITSLPTPLCFPSHYFNLTVFLIFVCHRVPKCSYTRWFLVGIKWNKCLYFSIPGPVSMNILWLIFGMENISPRVFLTPYAVKSNFHQNFTEVSLQSTHTLQKLFSYKKFRF